MRAIILTSMIICLGIVSAAANVNREEAAVAAIKELGGTVEYGEGRRARNVVSVDLSGSKAGNADLRHLVGLKYVRDLNLSGTSISTGTQYIAFLKELRTLDLSGTNVDDDNLARLSNLKKLEKISLRGTAVTEEGVRSIARISTLKTIDIARAQTADAALQLVSMLF
ncbi:MAG TPA: hypothetical protein PKD24_00185 [Pyrinomonadaceae bacterium]|nr:hypothetical protein [Pyrinomonadaceae bacterium]HMP64428.1 hypothetical protein [Pyrinomonadaceae bacterium]